MTADADNSTTAPESVAAQWARCQAMNAEIEAREEPTARDFDALSAIERLVFLTPAQTKADALAKLRAAIRSFEISTRNDGNDLRALAGVATWIEAQP